MGYGFLRQIPAPQPSSIRSRLAPSSTSRRFLLAQTSVRDYCRLRAGKGADALFANAAFAVVLDRAQWEAYPRAIAMVGEVLEAMLRPHAGANADLVLEQLTAIATEAFDRHAVPAAMREVDWRAARVELIRSLGALCERPPLPVELIADAQASWFLAIMPLHEKLGRDDFPALRGRLRALLLQFQGRCRAGRPAGPGAAVRRTTAGCRPRGRVVRQPSKIWRTTGTAGCQDGLVPDRYEMDRDGGA